MFVLKPHLTGVALAATLAILWTVCSGLYAVFPLVSLRLYSTLFHGFQMSIAASPLTPIGFLCGIVYLAIAGYVSGWLFASLYQAFYRRNSREPN